MAFCAWSTSRVLHRTNVAAGVKKYAKSLGTSKRPYRGKPAKFISEGSKEKRVAFCTENMHRNWTHVMFTDRKKFLFKHPGVHVKSVQWSKVGSRPKAISMNHPMSVCWHNMAWSHQLPPCGWHLKSPASPMQRERHQRTSLHMSRDLFFNTFSCLVGTSCSPPMAFPTGCCSRTMTRPTSQQVMW